MNECIGEQGVYWTTGRKSQGMPEMNLASGRRGKQQRSASYKSCAKFVGGCDRRRHHKKNQCPGLMFSLQRKRRVISKVHGKHKITLWGGEGALLVVRVGRGLVSVTGEGGGVAGSWNERGGLGAKSVIWKGHWEFRKKQKADRKSLVLG